MSDIVERLLAGSSGHGCWGQTEYYPPSDLEEEAAEEILRLRKIVKDAILSKLTTEEREALAI